MGKHARIGLVAAVVTLIAAGAAAHYAWREGMIPAHIVAAHPRAPLPENFLAVLKADRSATRYLKPVCLNLRLGTVRQEDRSGRAGMTQQPYPGWDVISVAQVPSQNGQRVGALTQALDALVQAKLYAISESETTGDAGARYKVKNYALTLAGWETMSEERCFNPGTPTAFKILEFSRVLSDTGSGDLYEVKAAYRMSELAAWARDKNVQSMAPQEQIKSLQEPVIVTTRLRRTDTGWSVEPSPPDFPVIDEDEALELITSSRRFAPPEACVRLPAAGSVAGIVVQPAPFMVTVYDEPAQSDPGAPLAQRLMWQARLATLTRAGLFQEEAVAADKARNTPAGTRYLIDPAYQQWLDINDAQCLRMGEASPELVDLTLASEPVQSAGTAKLARGKAKLLLRMDEKSWIHSVDLRLPEVEAVKDAGGLPAVAFLAWTDRGEDNTWQLVHVQPPRVELMPSPEIVAAARMRMLAAEQMALAQADRNSGVASIVASAMPSTAGAEGDVGWRPAHRGNGGGVSNAGLTATYCCAGASSAALSTRSVASGKVYAEFTLKARPLGKTADTYTSIGVLPGTVLDAAGDIFILDTRAATMAFRRGDEIANNDVIGLAIDLDRGEVHISRNGAWLSSAPGAVGGMPLKPGRPQYIAAVISASSSSGGTDSWTANFGKTRFRYPIPPGYRSYDGRQRG